MIVIENNIPLPVVRRGRKSTVRDSIISAMKDMNVGDSFRVEYTTTSIRNLLRLPSAPEGKFTAARDVGNFIRVWRVG